MMKMKTFPRRYRHLSLSWLVLTPRPGCCQIRAVLQGVKPVAAASSSSSKEKKHKEKKSKKAKKHKDKDKKSKKHKDKDRKSRRWVPKA